MTRTRERSPSPSPDDSKNLIKRLKTSHTPSTNGHKTPLHPSSHDETSEPSQFANGVFDHNNISRLHSTYTTNTPFKYSIVEKLFQDELLTGVKDECVAELSFTEKETDIYKVNQTGDLASLNYLTPEQISRLPSLLALRDALYSSKFRDFLRSVTGCGPLSGKKQDMSVNSYTRGCHLLNHDDVIGTRRVSYILYMPLPRYQLWQKDWGGALELYPTRMGEDGQPEPEAIPVKSIPPSWNQFIFFEVQPGKSFHSVEEVVVGGEGEDGRERLSISGWFHAAQEDEEGYIPEPPAETKSSREQLTSTSTLFNTFPSIDADTLPDTNTLSEAHTSFLSEFINPVYLQSRTMKALGERFIEESSLELHSFLSNALSESLDHRLRERDAKDGLGPSRSPLVPPHTAGTDGAWTIRGPPHKWRYCVLQPRDEAAPRNVVFPRAATVSPDELMRSLQDELFPSPAFRAWLAIVLKLMPSRYSVEARRFRPGLDYTLATSEEREARLDVVLGLTPSVVDGEGSERRPVARGWQDAKWGGWECYMAPHNEEDDPAVYRSSGQKKPKMNVEPTPEASSSTSFSVRKPDSDHDMNGYENGHENGHDENEAGESGEEVVNSSEEEEEEDGTLLTVQPGFNRLLLVLRDERVMRFVKYVSAAAPGSRWDVCGEYEVGMIQEEEGVGDDN